MINILLAILSGLLLTFSFPTMFAGWLAPSLGPLGWVALVPLFVAVADATPRRAFLITFITGLVCYGVSIYWIYHAVHVFGKMGVGISVVVTLLLVLMVSTYLAIIPMIARWIQLRWRGELIVLIPVVWTAAEFLRTYFPFGGFPWSNIAMSQWQALIPLQIVDIFGVYGLIFVMVWVNWFIAEFIMIYRGQSRAFIGAKLVATVLIIVGVIAYGMVRMDSVEERMSKNEVVSVGIVQGNIPQDQKWQATKARYNLDVYRKATKELFESGVDLIVWPEASFSQYVSDKVDSADPRSFGLPMETFGSLPAVMFGVIIYGENNAVYNSALLFDAKGALLGRYDKQHLVPFGEYVPLKKFLFFAKKMTAPVGDFQFGKRVEPLAFAKAKLGPLVCYEDAFPDISRRLVKNGADILVNVTNDAWYGWSSAAYQHLALGVFRSVETRRFTIRSTNTGVSAFISPTGDIVMKSPMFERLVMVGAVNPMTMLSPYVKYGDWFAWGCIAYTLIGLIVSFVLVVRRRKKRVKG